jgi:tetratricopeptide (TPR) repeat protein
MARARDVRARTLLFTLAAVAAGGLALAWMGGIGGQPDAQPLAAPDARLDPAGHAAARRSAEAERRFAQGVVMLHAKRYEHAMTAFHRVLELAPDSAETHVNMGFALIGLGRHAAARDFFESATELNRQQRNAYYGLAVALEALHDLPGAVGAMRTYVHLGRGDDPFVRKAQAALWEWESELARRRGAQGGGDAAGAR